VQSCGYVLRPAAGHGAKAIHIRVRGWHAGTWETVIPVVDQRVVSDERRFRQHSGKRA